MLTEHVPVPDPGGHGKLHSRFRITAWCLPPTGAARRARELLRHQLSGPPLTADVLDELEIVVSELATNATRYAPGPYELRLLRDHGLPVRAEVVDAGAGATLIEYLLNRPLPVPDRIDDFEVGGRGLHIVTELTHGRCGAQRTRLCGTGQLATGVWFELPALPHRP
ncbi:anti-sigma regulatory factor (Ser/Thr protein kinase) [Streptosporangium album]|uniref:Anti-sigma regulatory factor (Ser/Thr protein kinase) n=1 Tax=Streptosporangium album TaxID=47479 RepID=A0A7W7RZE2_9ACTN|nr:ATP-binding protein [Streptosporangium album]MBB4940955.1 anti-sigma regulatory factor (Ser/Thr protein kinase) [Streptosporangium album]